MHPRANKPISICIQGAKQTLLLNILIKRKFDEFKAYQTSHGVKFDLNNKTQDSFILDPNTHVTSSTDIALICPSSDKELQELLPKIQKQINQFDIVHIILAEKKSCINPKIVNQDNIPFIEIEDSTYSPAVLIAIKNLFLKYQPKEKIYAFLSGIHPTIKSSSSLKTFASHDSYDKNLRQLVLEFAFQDKLWKKTKNFEEENKIEKDKSVNPAKTTYSN